MSIFSFGLYPGYRMDAIIMLENIVSKNSFEWREVITEKGWT